MIMINILPWRVLLIQCKSYFPVLLFFEKRGILVWTTKTCLKMVVLWLACTKILSFGFIFFIGFRHKSSLHGGMYLEYVHITSLDDTY